MMHGGLGSAASWPLLELPRVRSEHSAAWCLSCVVLMGYVVGETSGAAFCLLGSGFCNLLHIVMERQVRTQLLLIAFALRSPHVYT